MKRLVWDRILLHLTWNNLLNDTQHEFMPKRSTLANLLCVKEDCLSRIDAKQDVYMVFVDLSKVSIVVNYRFIIA